MWNITQPNDESTDYITSSPSTGDTISSREHGRNQVCYLTPAADLLALTFNFPSNAASKIGQVITLVCTKNITTLTLNQTGGGITIHGFGGGTITIDVGAFCLSYRKVAPNIWVEISRLGAVV